MPRAPFICGSCKLFHVVKVLDQPAELPVAAMRESASQSCGFCALVLSQLEDRISEHYAADLRLWIRLGFTANNEDITKSCLAPGITAMTARLFLPEMQAESDPISLLVAADRLSPAAKTDFIRGRFLGRDLGSEDHIEAISTWLGCCMQHEVCTRTTSGVQIDAFNITLPTRCIEVTGKRIRLCETQGRKDSFIILSHRWGSDTEKCKTTTANYQTRLHGLSLDDLPPVLEHAIQLTRKLQRRYIWIDSLCIIQEGDGGQDWGKEGLKMSHYYQSALFTIFAAVPKDSQGLFRSRKIPFEKLAALPFRLHTDQPDGQFYVLAGSVDFAQEYRQLVRKSILLQRGWIFQEWFLSRRIVYFTPASIFFECQENYPMSEAHIELPHSSSPKLDPFYKAGIRKFASSPELLWYTLVEIYSELSLTKPEMDRIVALAGIADELRAIFIGSSGKNHGEPEHYEYIAGLWLRDIHKGLLWQRKNVERRHIPLAGPPSWSWASLQNPVCWDEQPSNVKPAMKITHLISGDNTKFSVQIPCNGCKTFVKSFSSSSEASLFPFALNSMFVRLRLEGRKIDVWIRESLEKEQYKFMRDATKSQMQDLWAREDNLTERALAWLQVCSISEPSIIAGWAAIDDLDIFRCIDPSKEYGVRLLALHVSTSSGVLGGISFGQLGRFGHTHDAYNVLFLTKADNASENQYKRVGMGCVFDKSVIQEFQKEVDVEMELI